MKLHHHIFTFSCMEAPSPTQLLYHQNSQKIYLSKKKLTHEGKEAKKTSFSPAGNRTHVSLVTGGDAPHYTTEDICAGIERKTNNTGYIINTRLHTYGFSNGRPR